MQDVFLNIENSVFPIIQAKGEAFVTTCQQFVLNQGLLVINVN